MNPTEIIANIADKTSTVGVTGQVIPFDVFGQSLLVAIGLGLLFCIVLESTCDWLFGSDQCEKKLSGKGLKAWIAGALAVLMVVHYLLDIVLFVLN